MKHNQEFQDRKEKSDFTLKLMLFFVLFFIGGGVWTGVSFRSDLSWVTRVREIIPF